MHQKQPVFVYRLIAEKVLQINVIWRKFQGLFVPWIAENHRKSCIFQTHLVFSRCYEFSTNINTACWKVTEKIWMSWVEFFLELTNLCFCEFVVDRKKQIIFKDKIEKKKYTVSFFIWLPFYHFYTRIVLSLCIRVDFKIFQNDTISPSHSFLKITLICTKL